MGLLLILVAAVGAGLRTWQYAAGTSLWLDEIGLVWGILDLDLFALLTSPLPHDQIAPKGFLLIQKLAVMALGPSDYALRQRSLRTFDAQGPFVRPTMSGV